MARYSVPILLHCDGCDAEAQTYRQHAEFVRRVPARGVIQPIGGRAMKQETATAMAVVLHEVWANPQADAPKVQTIGGAPDVSPFAPANLVAAATGCNQPAYLCPACAKAAGVAPEVAPPAPEDKPDPDAPILSDAPEAVQ